MSAQNRTYLLGVILIIIALALGLYIGAYHFRRAGAVFTRSSRPGTGMMQRRGFGNRNFANRGFMGRGASGQITNISGNTVTITLPNGTTEKINLSNSTAYSKIDSASQGDLKQGETILVVGSKSQDGSISAQSIRINAATSSSSPLPQF